MSDRFRIDGKAALVTGGGRGLGRAMAVGLAEAGADVCVVARRADDLAETVKLIEATGRRGLAFVGDVCETATATGAVAACVEAFGSLDILVNNAGLYGMGPLADTPDDDWVAVIDTNLVASFRFAKAAASHLAAGGWGRVLNVSSVLGTFGVGEATAYCAAKAGVAGFTRSLAIEWAPSGVGVNAIAPGLFNTDMSAGVMENKEFYDMVVGGIPRGKHGEPDEIVGTAVWLCTPASNHVVGQTVHVDGGATIA